MPINYQRIGNVTAGELESALFRDGFTRVRIIGSRRHYRNNCTGRKATLAWHGRGQTLSLATLRCFIEAQAGRTDADLIRLRLMRG